MDETTETICPHCEAVMSPETVARGPYAGRSKCTECGKTFTEDAHSANDPQNAQPETEIVTAKEAANQPVPQTFELEICCEIPPYNIKKEIQGDEADVEAYVEKLFRVGIRVEQKNNVKYQSPRVIKCVQYRR